MFKVNDSECISPTERLLLNIDRRLEQLLEAMARKPQNSATTPSNLQTRAGQPNNNKRK